MSENKGHWLDSVDDGIAPPEIDAQIAKYRNVASIAKRFIEAVVKAEGAAWYGAEDEGEILLTHDGDGAGWFDVCAALEAALPPELKTLAGLSTAGINVWGSPTDIKSVMDWEHSHATIDDVRTNLRHWSEECGKVHAKLAEATGALKRVAMTLEDRSPDFSLDARLRIHDAVYPVLIALETVK